MKPTVLYLLCSIIIFASCEQQDPNKQIDEGKVTGESYHSDDIGWTIEIPKGYTVTSKDKLDENDNKGKAALEKTAGGKIDMQTLKHLISFQKNQFNSFGSTTQPYKEESPGDYEKNNKYINELMYETYKNQGIRADTSSGKETIQGLEFSVFFAAIHGPDGKVILHQILYSRLVNGFDFGVNINYNNQPDADIMLKAWRNSKFK